MSAEDLDQKDVVVLDKTQNPAIERLGYKVVDSGKEFASYIQRQHLSVAVIHFSNISAEDCLYINEINQQFRGKLTYFGIAGDYGLECDSDMRDLIGPEVAFEKVFQKNHNKTQLDHQILLFQRKLALARSNTLRPEPNVPSSQRSLTTPQPQPSVQKQPAPAPARNAKRSKQLKTTQLIFACLVVSGALTLGYVVDLLSQLPAVPTSVAKSTVPPKNPQASKTRKPPMPPPSPTYQRSPIERPWPARPSVTEPSEPQLLANSMPRLPISTEHSGHREHDRENGILVSQKPLAKLDPRKIEPLSQIDATTNIASTTTSASAIPSTNTSEPIKPKENALKKRESKKKEPSSTPAPSEPIKPKENELKKRESKKKEPSSTPAPPETVPPSRKVAILSAAQKQKVAQFHALAITQIQQKNYLSGSRKSALYYLNQIHELTGPNRTVKSLANNITGNILKDAANAIKYRDTLALERAVDHLRAIERHIRSLSPDIHQRVSYQRLLSRYHKSVTRSEPILGSDMTQEDKEYFRRALEHLRTLLKDLCEACSAMA